MVACVPNPALPANGRKTQPEPKGLANQLERSHMKDEGEGEPDDSDRRNSDADRDHSDHPLAVGDEVTAANGPEGAKGSDEKGRAEQCDGGPRHEVRVRGQRAKP